MRRGIVELMLSSQAMTAHRRRSAWRKLLRWLTGPAP